jgi:hypothetical protein
MRKICAWCKKDMGMVPSVKNANGFISHGICEDCVNRIFAQMGIRQSVFLDIAVPVAVVDAGRKTGWTTQKMTV